MKKMIIAGILSVFIIGGATTAVVINHSNDESVNSKVAVDDVQTGDKNSNKKQEKATVNSTDKNTNEEKAQKNNTVDKNNSVNSKVSTVSECSEPNKSNDTTENIVSNNNCINSENVNSQSSNTNTTTTNNNTTNTNTNTNTVTKPVQDTTQNGQVSTENSSDFMSQVESMIFTKVNEERSKNGLAPLSYNTTMEHYARFKSQDMGDRGYFDHNNPEGELITAKMAREGVSYNAWGENIAYIGGVSDPTTLANQFMTNWMNSPGHRANILSNNFSSIGVGVYKIGNKVYATQEFYR